uniref:Immunoglobulin domain-containing protein n=1 Tax=Cyprinus carpio TaxID=7962 RepID=A0A8C1YFF5_CYPCA
MQKTLLLSLLLLFMGGVSGGNETGSVSVMEGDSVTLHTDVSEINNDDTLLWVFGPKEYVISQITRKNDLTSFFVTDDERFRGRLQVDQKIGSLTIRNTRITHSGQYKLTISREKTTTKIFSVTIFGVVNETDGMKSVSVMEGDSVTLHTDAEIHTDDLIVWRFGDKGILLAKLDVGTNESSLNDADERFKDRLQLNQTGSLTIKNTRTEHTGLYEVQIRGSESSQRFLLSVTALPDPGLSPGLIVGIAAAVLLFLTAVVAVVVIYYCHKFSEPKKQVVRTEPVKSGDFVTLNIDSEIKSDDLILWTFGAKNCLVVKVDSGTTTISENFIGRLQLDHQSGSLTIRNTRTTDSGVYKLQIINSEQTTFRRFNVTVTGSE